MEVNGDFTIKVAYKKLLSLLPKVPWCNVISKNKASPQSVFILWMTIQGRLITKDRLIAWHVDVDP